jgi:hypothetical protein
LTGVAGCVDAMAFLKLKHLFVSFMSGDSTHIAVAASAGMWAEALSPAAIVALYLLGVAVGRNRLVNTRSQGFRFSSSYRGRPSGPIRKDTSTVPMQTAATPKATSPRERSRDAEMKNPTPSNVIATPLIRVSQTTIWMRGARTSAGSVRFRSGLPLMRQQFPKAAGGLGR